MYLFEKLQHLQDLKVLNDLLSAEIKKFSKYIEDPTTIGSKKRICQNNLITEMKKVQHEFKKTVFETEILLNSSPFCDVYKNIICFHFFDLRKMPESLQSDIELFDKNLSASNFRAILKRNYVIEAMQSPQ